MADPSWNVPRTEEGLQTLLARIEESRSLGDEAGIGHGKLALAYVVVWVRSDNDEPPFQRAATLSEEALQIFRRVPDDLGLLNALLATSRLRPADESDRMLDEAMEIAERMGELQIARTLNARGRALAMRDRETSEKYVRQALEIFRRLGDKSGQARCLFTLCIASGTKREQYEMAQEAAALFREIGESDDACKAVQLAIMKGENLVPLTEMEALFHQGLADAQAVGSTPQEAVFYGHLARLSTEKGDSESAEKYSRWQKELGESDGLTPKERHQNEIEMTKELLAMAEATDNQESVKLFREELRRLKRLHVR